MTFALALTPEQLAANFPFHVAVDEGLRVRQVGRVLARLRPELVEGAPLDATFRIARPETVSLRFDDLRKHASLLFILEALDGGLRLRGGFVDLQREGVLLFLGSPWVTSAADVKRLGLTFDDFALHDPVLDMMQVLQSNVQALDDVRQLNQRLTRQRAELRDTNRELGLLYAVSQLLADAPTLEAATPGLLERSCEAGGWELGALWVPDPAGGRLVCAAVHARDPARQAAFIQATRARTFECGIGLPGRVCASRQPAWIHDVQQDANFPRAEAARQAGLHGACAFPVPLGAGGVAVCEFFACEARTPDERALRIMSEVGAKVGHFLERRAAEEELRRAKEAAEAATLAKSQFLASMSHELRTPLNAILGFVQLMELDRTISPTQREHLGVITRAGEHLLGLINDVLSISRIEAGQLDLHEAPFDLRRLVGGFEAIFRHRAEAKGIALRLALDESLPQHVSGDEGKLRQILFNLMGNAVKFTPPGGEVALEARAADGRGTFAVRDTGPGMTPDEVGQLFRPFVQTETGKKAREGTGLGLAISRNYARLMGGDIRVESSPGRGTTFTLELPLRVADGALPDTDGRPVVGLAEGEPPRRVLVVDDAPENRRFLVQVLGGVGLEVREASDGREAVERWAAWHPHVVLMDIRMPVMDGLEATREVRRQETAGKLPRTAIIALTASAFEHDRQTILAAGCDGFIPKPFVIAKLWKELERRVGVRFEREGPAPRAAASTAAAGSPAEGSLAAVIAAQPADWRGELHHALTIGDDLAAAQVIDRLAGRAPAAADELRALLRAMQFDALLALLEAAP